MQAFEYASPTTVKDAVVDARLVRGDPAAGTYSVRTFKGRLNAQWSGGI